MDYWELFRLGVMEQKKPKLSSRPIRTKENITSSQWELKVKTTKQLKARENASDQGVTNFSFEFNFFA